MSRGQRQHPRFDATLRVEFADTREFLSAYTNSISKGGLFVESDSPLPEGAHVRLHLRLPTTGEIVEVSGTVAYVIDEDTQTAVRQPPGMGIEFGDMDDGTLAAIHDYVRFVEDTCKGRVLFVDDDLEYAGMLQDVLREHEYSVVCVNSAQAGLNTLRHGGFDILVVDLDLPRMDGLELADAVRGLPHGDDLAVLLLGDQALDDDQHEIAERLGVLRSLVKPVGLDGFVELVEEARELKEQESSVRPDGVVPAGPADGKRPDGRHHHEPPDEKYDPEQEATLARMRREAQIAYKYLSHVGVRARYNRERTEVLGELLFQHRVVDGPFGSEAIPRVAVRSVGHDRVSIYAPERLARLPSIPFLDLKDQQELEGAIESAIVRREAECHQHLEWLKSLNVPARLDTDDFACRGVVVIADQPVVFSVVEKGIVEVDRVGARPAGGVLSPEERRVDIDGVETTLELEMNIEPVARKLLLESNSSANADDATNDE